MPGLSGIEVARHASGRSHVVFVTAYDKYAVAAFEEGAVDYLLKPFGAERLETAVARLNGVWACEPNGLFANPEAEWTMHRVIYGPWRIECIGRLDRRDPSPNFLFF